MKFIANFIVITIVGCSVLEDRKIRSSLRQMNEELLSMNRLSAELGWQSATNSSNVILALKKEFAKSRTKWRNDWCKKFENLDGINLREERMIYLLCRGPVYSENEARILTSVGDKLLQNYKIRQVCRLESKEKKCYHGEPELKKIMAESRNESELLWAWTSWRNEMSNVRNLFTLSVRLQNIGAQNNGYNNIGECWREELEIPNLENFVENLYSEVMLLYRLLHAVVRYRLGQTYPKIVRGHRPIPAHLLGDLWSQNWETLIDLILPKSKNSFDVTKALKKKNYTILDMVKRAEDYYESLGFPSLPGSFWKRSIFTKNNSSDANCHATAANMFNKNDFRIIACLDISAEDFYVVHHEMGHIQYYMAYEKQPAIFRNGVSSAFHEAIGDAVMLGVMTPHHLQRLGLADDRILTDGFVFSDLSILLRQALAKLPQLPHALLIDKWRWKVFEGKADSSNYNSLWWDFHKFYMGIEPPSPRDDKFFDPAAKFHVVSNTPYVRYFLANILQYQLFASMCQSAVTGKIGDPKFSMRLHSCDIYGSKDAGKRLRSLMSLGSSINWRNWIRDATGDTKISAKSLLRYYEPLKNWLESEIERHKIPVGWN